MRSSTQPSACSLTSSSSSAQAWRESTDILRPRVRDCREKEAGVEEAVEVVAAGEEEVMTEAGVREVGSEEAGIEAVEVGFVIQDVMLNAIF